MQIEDLVELDAAGFLVGCGESESEYLERVERIKNAHCTFDECLEKEGCAEALPGMLLKRSDSIPEEFYDAPAEITNRLYGFKVHHVPGFFLSEHVGWLWGGCLIGDPELFFSFFLLRDTFKTREKWFLYSRNELLAHELCHSARQALGENTLEEYFAYQTSPSGLRRHFGNCFINDRDAVLFLLPSLVLLTAEIFRGFFYPAFPAWVFWIVAIIYPAFLLFRNHRSMSLVRKAKKALLRCEIKAADAVLFRCSRQELVKIGKISTKGDLEEFVSTMANIELRWRIIKKRFI